MISHTDNRSIRVVIRYLSRADHFNKLAKRCPRKNRRAYYKLKDRAIDRAIAHSPDDFEVDSLSDGAEPILGVTHVPSGRLSSRAQLGNDAAGVAPGGASSTNFGSRARSHRERQR